jgi:hypothetical protein
MLLTTFIQTRRSLKIVVAAPPVTDSLGAEARLLAKRGRNGRQHVIRGESKTRN